MLTDHFSDVDAKVTKCCETLASNSSSASSSVVVNVLFFNISESDASNLEAGRNYVSKFCKDTFDLDVKILKAFILARKCQTNAGHC